MRLSKHPGDPDAAARHGNDRPYARHARSRRLLAVRVPDSQRLVRAAARPRESTALQRSIVEVMPVFADRVGELDRLVEDFDCSRCASIGSTRWHRPGLLCIGDAAHAMSPIGGIGINLAIQDAVATANLLADCSPPGAFRAKRICSAFKNGGCFRPK